MGKRQRKNRGGTGCKTALLLLSVLLLQGCAAVKDAGMSNEGKPVENRQQASIEGQSAESTQEMSGGGQPTESAQQTSGEGQFTESVQEASEETQPAESAQETNVGEQPTEGAQEASEGLAAPSCSGALRVQDGRLTDQNGVPVQLRGISTHGLAWFPEYVNEDCFRQLRQEWQANVIRLALYTAESGGYCTDGDREALWKLVQDGVSYATQQDMYVIIDWHVLSEQNPNVYLEQAKAFFADAAESYADYDNVLYEICNEPNGQTGWSDIKSYAEAVIPVIREKDGDGIILIGTPNWSQAVEQAAADPVEGYDNLMYTLHFYAATHKDELRGSLTAAAEAGLPIFVSEYGICDASGNGAIDEEQAQKWTDTMDALGVSYVAWNLSNKAETSAILRSDCAKTSGFVWDDLSESGRWVYRLLTGKTEEK